MRGATVEFILCDGLLPECDMHWDSFPGHTPRPFDLCKSCQARAKRNMAELELPIKGLPYRWLGEFVSEAEKRSAFTWAQGLSHSEISRATFMEYPIGEWVLSSMVSYFRQYPPDMDNWHVVNVYRGFLFSAAIVTIGLRNYLETYSVESVFLFNGRASITRVAFEIFQRLGIRVLTHETPFYQRGHHMLKPNARCWSPGPFNEFWSMWGQVPLTRPSLEKTLKWLKSRRYATGLTWYAFNAPYDSDLSPRNVLNLRQNKRMLALFTSSTDETAGDSELQGPYESQASWVQDVIDWIKDKNDVELVIRVHPHLAGNTGLGKAVDEFNFYHNIKSEIHANVRVIMPDDSMNSYALMDEADICLSFGSSVGIEMAMLGKPVVLASRAFYEDGYHILRVHSKQSLPEMLEKSLLPFSALEIQREAFRLAYYYVFKFELPFPLVSMERIMDAKLNYSVPDELVPGQDDALDHICNYLINGYPLFDFPTESELARTTAEEDAFFAELVQAKQPFSDVDYEKWLERTSRLHWIGRSIQNVLKRLPLGIGNILNSMGKAFYLPFLRRMGKKP
jgi:hypothetical protein